jgi:hypothetical protein
MKLAESPGSIVRSSIGGCRPPDPGSNPGQGASIKVASGTTFLNFVSSVSVASSLHIPSKTV